MSIILNPQIACFEELKTAHPAKVVAGAQDGRALKAFSSLRIGVVNLMPTKAATERQWSKLMLSSKHWIEPIWIRMESRQSKNTATDYLEAHYVAPEGVQLSELDGLILTGAPVEHLAFSEVDYWQELVQFLDRAEAAHVPILSVCWGAQALLYKRYGIPKQPLREKCFGVFEHQHVSSHPLTTGLKPGLLLPHSRHTGWASEALSQSSALEVLIASAEAGVFALEDQEGDLFLSGHAEYESDTLVLEYERDRAKGLDQKPPQGYTQDDSGAWTLSGEWRETAVQIFGNWIDEIGPRLEHPVSF